MTSLHYIQNKQVQIGHLGSSKLLWTKTAQTQT